MDKKNLSLLLLLIILGDFFLMINIAAIGYTLDVKENTTVIWRIDAYDEAKYNLRFQENPKFDEGAQQKIEIKRIEEKSSKWQVSYDVWEYTHDTDKFFEDPDDEWSISIYKDPEDKSDEISSFDFEPENILELWIVPTPFINYIQEVRDYYSGLYQVSVSESAITLAVTGIPFEYQIKITYGFNGIADKIEYLDMDENAFVRIIIEEESNLLILIIIFVIIAIIAIIGVFGIVIWRKRRSHRETPRHRSLFDENHF